MRTRLRFALAVPVILASALIAPLPAVAAETLSICGLNFEIDELRPGDDKNDKVVLFGRTWLVPKAKLEVFIVGKYFERPEGVRTFPFDALSRCAATTLSNRQDEIAYRALAALLTYPPQPGQTMPEFLDNTEPLEPRVSENFQRALIIAGGNVVNQSVAGPVLFQTAMHDVAWTKRAASKLVTDFAGDIEQYGESRFNRAIRNGNGPYANKIVRTLAELLGDDSPTVVELRERQKKVQAILAGLNDGTGIMSTVEKLHADPLLSNLIAPQISELLIAEASRAQQAGDNERALEVLGMVDRDKYSAAVPQIVKAVLEAMDGTESAVFDTPQATELLEIMVWVDPRIKELYSSRIHSRIRSLLRERKIEESEALFEQLLRYRPDPSEPNDNLRIEQAKVYLALGQEEAARQKIKNVTFGTSIGKWFNLLLFWARAYVLVLVGLLAFSAVLAVSIAVWITRRFKPQEPAAPIEDQEEDEAPEPLPKFVVSGLKETINPEYRDYVTCLKVFGLKPGSDLAAIKNAYRKAVKAYHPDMNKEGEAMASEVFVEMTKTYERLLEMFRKHGGPPPRA